MAWGVQDPLPPKWQRFYKERGREHDMPSSRFLQKKRGGPLDGKALDLGYVADKLEKQNSAVG
jgi:hypothetical protein